MSSGAGAAVGRAAAGAGEEGCARARSAAGGDWEWLGRPDQALSVLVAGQPPEGELLPRRVHERPVAVEDVRERSIGHPALALEKRDEGWQRRVYPCPGVRGRLGGRALGRGFGEGRAAGLAEPCPRANLMIASCAEHGGETTTVQKAPVRAQPGEPIHFQPRRRPGGHPGLSPGPRRNCQHAEGLAAGRLERAVLPRAVRNYETQESPLFARVLSHEESVSTSRKFEVAARMPNDTRS
jgi:hypothetical protein